MYREVRISEKNIQKILQSPIEVWSVFPEMIEFLVEVYRKLWNFWEMSQHSENFKISEIQGILKIPVCVQNFKKD